MIKLGTIGTNWITDKFIDAAKNSKKYELAAVYSRSETKAGEYAKKHGAQAAFANIDDFFASDKFDTVYIASPNSAHFEQAKQAIIAGKNVIVEKPAFLNQKEMTDIQTLLAEHPDVLLFEAARNVHTENFKLVKQQVNKMAVVTGAEFTYSKYSSRYDKVLAGETPNVFSLQYGGGALQDLGVYTVYDAVALFGVPEEVAYFPSIIATGVDGKGTAILKYPDFNVTLNFSKISNSQMPSEVSGLKDFVEMDDAGELTTIAYFDGDTKETLSTPSEDNPMLGEVLDFASVIEQPDSDDSKRDYTKWTQMSIDVNKVMYNLRQDAKLVFVGETD
ncbi:Gfo/Idh/MocA family oxidoreductase [Lentilactobacillus sp. Marseille-Q4993]|uniref:Gfo/Idh/MocA family protein n=1 Tax=Lentilactobacillus sp. Marseille-Q4993 TaxID=3039492 RepID=UPI0024BC7224|nr:Gfo/Idh/MocA family oxidoreductase [Lentilactobacillus sp. Marseille-Q4993]